MKREEGFKEGHDEEQIHEVAFYKFGGRSGICC